MNSEIKCIECNHGLFQKIGGKIKLRTNILIFEKSEEDDFGKAVIKCPLCKKDNVIPIILNTNDSKMKLFIFENK